MFKARDAVLVYQETQSSDKSTKTIDLDIVDPISALCFEFDATNGTTNNQNNPLHRCVTKIEVVDGSDVICSMSFEEAQALQFYKTGKQPQLRLDEGPSAGSPIGCAILFGRYLYDQEYALNLARFKNPQLKISWDLTKIRAVAADTAFATGTFKISAWAKVMEGLSAPANYLMDKKVDEWTGGSSGDKRRELPLDYAYRMIMLRSYYQGDDIDETTSKLKLTCDADKFIAFERYVKQFDAEMAQQFGDVVVWKRGHYAHNDTVWLPINKEPQVRFSIAKMGYVAAYGWCWSGQFGAFVADASGSAYMTDNRIDLLIEGHALHATLPIPMGDLTRPETWFDPTQYRKVELICTEGSDAAEQAIIIEQVRPNA